MKNTFDIHGSDVVIHLPFKDGIKTAMVSLEDFDKVSSITGTWRASCDGDNGQRYYVRTQVGGVVLYMHHFIIQPQPGNVIDHINHDTLDNRRDNLREVTHAQNGQNRKGAQRNNRSSGLRNVYASNNGKWVVQLTKNGRRIHIGTFPAIDVAEEVAETSRNYYYEYDGDGTLEFDSDGSLLDIKE